MLKANLDELKIELSEIESRIDSFNDEDRKVFEQEALKLMVKVPKIIAWSLDQNLKDIEALRAQKGDASSTELGILEEEISILVSSIDAFYETKLNYLEELEKLGAPDEDLAQSVKEDLKLRARLMTGRLKKHTAERSVIKKRLNASAEDPDLALQLGAKQIVIPISPAWNE